MKYKILLLDDNNMALEALKQTIPWNELGLELVGSAYNGREGCEMIDRHHPDIILTDIQMPDMDGLTMIELKQEALTASRVIFITAYEKFEYASRAIKLAAFDFILKPAEDEEICRVLRRAINSLEQEHSEKARRKNIEAIARRARFLTALNAPANMVTQETFLGFMNSMPERYIVLIVQSPGGDIFGPQLQRLDYIEWPDGCEIVSGVADNDPVLLCGMHDTTSNWQLIARKLTDQLLVNLLNVTVSVSDPHSEASELSQAYEEALSAQLRHNIYDRRRTVDFYNEPDFSNDNRSHLAEVEEICSKLAAGVDELSAQDVWQVIMEKSNGRIRQIKVMLMFFCTKVIQSRMRYSHWSKNPDMTVYSLPKLRTVEGAREWLERFFDEIRRANVPLTKSLVRDVLEYIRVNVTEGLYLEDVAEKFFVSPNHLSAMIKKETGITYRQHVINVKMAMAKQMLDDTRMRVEDIAYAIGYESYISFYNIFRKSEHMSPSEYRVNKKGE